MTAILWPGPRRIAHRGGGVFAPENTLAAMRTAVEYGYHGVEFDVMLSADDVPILMHDERFGRTIAGDGEVARMTAAELAACDAGSWFDGSRFAGEPVPTLADVMRFCAIHELWMNVEIKPSSGTEAETGAVVARMCDEGVRGAADPATRLLLSSFSVEALDAARAAAPVLSYGLLVDRVDASTSVTARDLGCIAIHVDQATLDRQTVQGLKTAGFAVMAWTVNDAARAGELVGWGVDAICTDRLDLPLPDRAKVN